MSVPFVSVERASKRFVRPAELGDRIVARIAGRRAVPEVVHAVTDVSLEVAAGEWLGLVGESGCGKSTLGRLVAGVYVPDEGCATIAGAPVARYDGGRVAKLTTRVQMIHQDPFASLNPRLRVGETIIEGPRAHGLVRRGDEAEFVVDLMGKVGLDPGYARRLPHQFSGGQRQRIAIARALAMRPDVIVADEPVASLDVSVQAQVLNLFLDLKNALGLAALFISHDIGVVRHVCRRIAIMYLGRVVETGPAIEVTAKPEHPYTRALMASVPRVGGVRGDFQPITGEIPSPLDPPRGCAFHPRCPVAGPRCRSETPKLAAIAADRDAACHIHSGGVG
ncbi:MAG: ATP-binding cassette domain-containing protein [Hyphomicrobiaceae bacterium]